MAQQGRNDNTYGFDELAFWRPIDAENRPVYRAVLRESRAIQDEAQDILNRFAGLSMMGLLPKAQVERLHRDIARWKKQGESTGELRLLMQDAQRRTRMRCDEAMLLYLMHAISDSYARISETDRGALLSASRIAYKRAFAEGNEITRLGAKSVPGAKFVRDTLSNNPLPTGLTYEQALAADAAYRAREITKQAVVDSSQGKELSMDSEPMQAILRRQRAWQLREVKEAPEEREVQNPPEERETREAPENREEREAPGSRFTGYYDMVMGFIVGHTVVQAFMDAGVKAYRFIATIDDRTTSECRALHGKVFRMEELKLGINAPPVYPPPHPCRSVIQAVEVADTGQHDIIGIGRGTGISSDGGALVENAVNVGHINFNDSTQVEEQFRDFIDKNRDSDHESIRIITKSGDVYDILGGQVRINLEGMDDFLDGAKTIHNHPTGYSEYSFSSDRQDDDIPSFFRENGSMMEAFDEKYRYRFNRPANVTLEQWNEAYAASDKIAFEMLDAEGYSLDDDLVTLLQHYKILGTCKSLGIDGSYTRWEF